MPANRELRADGPGLVSIAAAMVLFLYGVSQAVSGLTRVEFWLPTVAGLVLFAVHYQLERRSSQPMFPPGLYERGLFAAAVVSGIGWNFAQSVVQLQTSNFWQVVQRFSTTQVALGQLPLLICFGGGGIVAGRLHVQGRLPQGRSARHGHHHERGWLFRKRQVQRGPAGEAVSAHA